MCINDGHDDYRNSHSMTSYLLITFLHNDSSSMDVIWEVIQKYFSHDWHYY